MKEPAHVCRNAFKAEAGRDTTVMTQRGEVASAFFKVTSPSMGKQFSLFTSLAARHHLSPGSRAAEPVQNWTTSSLIYIKKLSRNVKGSVENVKRKRSNECEQEGKYLTETVYIENENKELKLKEKYN